MRPFTLVRWVPLIATLAVAACAGVASRPPGAAEVHAVTGAHTRVVWVQGDGTDPFATSRQLVLMALDTDDGRGERQVLAERGSYVKPMLTPRGDRIVYSTHPDLGDPSVYFVGFDGSGLRRFDRGLALAVWEDPADGGEWVYIGSEYGRSGFGAVTRVRVDRPSERAEVWRQAPISFDTFQVSPDGAQAGGLFPWPAAGVADLRAGTWRRLGDGCWTALNDVGAPLFWYFDGSHRNVQMVDVNRDRRWVVPLNRAPGFQNPEVYHPRWARHPRFIAISGPYDQGGANQVRSGGTQAEIWIGRFNDDFTQIEAWARATDNSGGDSYPDVWIDREESPYPLRAAGRVGPAAAAPAAAAGRLVVDARLIRAGDVPAPDTIAPYRHALSVSQYEIVTGSEGEVGGRTLLVAHWVIRDAAVLPNAQRAVGQMYRLTVERYAAHAELEGERLIQGRDMPDLPLHYDVGS